MGYEERPIATEIFVLVLLIIGGIEIYLSVFLGPALDIAYIIAPKQELNLRLPNLIIYILMVRGPFLMISYCAPIIVSIPTFLKNFSFRKKKEEETDFDSKEYDPPISIEEYIFAISFIWFFPFFLCRPSSRS